MCWNDDCAVWLRAGLAWLLAMALALGLTTGAPQTALAKEQGEAHQ